MHTEHDFENSIEYSLLNHGGYTQGNPKTYDKQTALFPDDPYNKRSFFTKNTPKYAVQMSLNPAQFADF